MEIILYVLCSSVPNHLIVFFQFWDYSWRSKKLAIALALLCLIAKVPLISWAVGAGHSVRLVEFVFSLFAAGIYFVMIRTDVFKLVLTYVLSVDYLIVARGVASFIAARYLGVNALSWQCSLLCILVYLLTLPVTMYFFRRGAQTVRDTDAPGLWRVIWLLPALTSVVVVTFTSAFDPNSVSSWTSLAARLSLLVCVIVVSCVLIQSLDGLRRSAAMEEKARQMENILNLQRSQYAKLQAHMEEVRQASHDLRQHRNIINSYLESGDETRLREYLSAHADKGAADTFRCYCRNYSVNMLLNHYAERLREQGDGLRVQLRPAGAAGRLGAGPLRRAGEPAGKRAGGLLGPGGRVREGRGEADGRQRPGNRRGQQRARGAEARAGRRPVLDKAQRRGHRHELRAPDSAAIPRQGGFQLERGQLPGLRLPEPENRVNAKKRRLPAALSFCRRGRGGRRLTLRRR